MYITSQIHVKLYRRTLLKGSIRFQFYGRYIVHPVRVTKPMFMYLFNTRTSNYFLSKLAYSALPQKGFIVSLLVEKFTGFIHP